MPEALQVRKLEEPFTRMRAAVMRDAVFAALRGMAVGEALELNRNCTSMRWYIMKFYKEAPNARYAVRQSKPKWSKVWRLADRPPADVEDSERLMSEMDGTDAA